MVKNAPDYFPVKAWEGGLVSLAVVIALLLGFSNLGQPSLWHDETVHVFVARSILATGIPRLPSGQFYVNGLLYNYLLALFIKVFPENEVSVRSLSVILGSINVALLFFITRRLLGKTTALIACFALAVSPWQISWMREARFYTLQQTLYLSFLWAMIPLFFPTIRLKIVNIPLCILLYILSIATSLHSILFMMVSGACAFWLGILKKSRTEKVLIIFLSASIIGCFATTIFVSFALGAVLFCAFALLIVILVHRKVLTSQPGILLAGTAVLVATTLFAYYFFLSQADHDAIFREGGLRGTSENLHLDKARADRFYYLRFFGNNLSRGIFWLTMLGFLGLVTREKEKGLFLANAFWVPALALSYIGYRQHRFLYFAFPLFLVATSYGALWLCSFCAKRTRTSAFLLSVILVSLFMARVTVSMTRLVSDSLTIAYGADVTLAKQHPRWREPCRYIAKKVQGDFVVISTDFLPVLYYVGRCDNWFPSRVTPWEWVESGMKGLHDTKELEEYVRLRPSGFFIAEHRKFWYVKRFIPEEIEWVKKNLVWVKEASNPDVSVFAWGEAVKTCTSDQVRTVPSKS